MANRFYVSGAERTERVSELFGAIAGRYDLINDIQSLGLHRWWKRRLVRLAALTVGDAALDVCCGTGDIAFRLARQGVRVTGLDFSEPMLAVARQRLAESTLPSIHSDTDCAAGTTSDDAGPVKFMQGDAMALPFKSDQFDAVTVGYGLRNLADWKVGLGEMVRVAKAGGRILVLDFGRPHNALLRTLYFMYLRFMVPCFGLLFCGNASAYAYILESLHHYPAQDGVAVEMRELGLEQVQIHQLLGGMMSINVGTKTIAKPGTA